MAPAERRREIHKAETEEKPRARSGLDRQLGRCGSNWQPRALGESGFEGAQPSGAPGLQEGACGWTLAPDLSLPYTPVGQPGCRTVRQGREGTGSPTDPRGPRDPGTQNGACRGRLDACEVSRAQGQAEAEAEARHAQHHSCLCLAGPAPLTGSPLAPQDTSACGQDHPSTSCPGPGPP